MAKAIYRNPGNTINYVNSGSMTIDPGDVVVVGSRICVAGSRIDPSETGSVHTVGVFALPKTDKLAINQGDCVYFSTSTQMITKTDTDVPAGWAVADAAGSDTVVYVKIG